MLKTDRARLLWENSTLPNFGQKKPKMILRGFLCSLEKKSLR